MENRDAIIYKPSVVVIFLKRCVLFLEKILPNSWYNEIYDRGFSFYRFLLRAFYTRHILYSFLTGDKKVREKAVAVLKVMPYSLVGANGLEATYDAVRAIERNNIRGSLVECGVAQGGSAALMSLVTARSGGERYVWLFDSFEGLPEPSENDFADGVTGRHVRELPPGSCLGLQEQVESLLFDKLDLDAQKIILVKGWFEETIAPNVEEIGSIAVLRIDADWYESVKHCLSTLYDNVVVGGYVIIDDYGSCFGARKAVDEFLTSNDISVELTHDGRGGCYFIKPSIVP